jgi:uncharacterized LabA/DUF88 family protein
MKPQSKAQTNTHIKRKVNKMKRIAVFVDGSNFYYTQKKLGWEVDSERLLDYCKEYGEIVEAIYYASVSSEENQRKFHNWLAYNGYSLLTKSLKSITDYRTVQTTQKASLDIEIVLDIFNMIDRYDVAILLAGMLTSNVRFDI